VSTCALTHTHTHTHAHTHARTHAHSDGEPSDNAQSAIIGTPNISSSAGVVTVVFTRQWPATRDATSVDLTAVRDDRCNVV
jgi:hypothetical protein